MWDILNYLADNHFMRAVLMVWLFTVALRLGLYNRHRKQRLARMLYVPTKAESRMHEEIAELKRKYDDLVDAVGTATNLSKHNGREIIRVEDLVKKHVATLSGWIEYVQEGGLDPLGDLDEENVKKVEVPPTSLFEQNLLDVVRQFHAATWHTEYRQEFIRTFRLAAQKAYEQQCALEGQQELEKRKRQNSVANLSVMGVDGNEHQIGGYYQAKTPDIKCPECGSHNIRGGHSKIDGTTVCTCNECEHRWETKE